MKQRAKHEERIERVMGTTIGTYGNINGIAGKTLQKIEGLSLEASPDASDGSLRETAS
jgi:hypothetical protein